MNPYKEVMLQRLESLGVQVFELEGSVSLLLGIIGRLDDKSIDCLLDLIENKSCEEKYNLAKRIIIEGFDKVVNDSKQITTTIETILDEEQEVTDNEGIITPDMSEDDSNEEQTNLRVIVDQNKTSNESLDMSVDIIDNEEDEEEVIIAVNQSSELLDTSDSYVDTSGISSIFNSPDSYRSALASPQSTPQTINPNQNSGKSSTNLSPNKSLEILIESGSYSMDISENMSSSTPSKGTDRLSGQILNLSPITSQSKLSVSPTFSLNMSTTSSHSTKSMISSKRSPIKSVEKIIDENKSLVPYQSYCSEQKYFGSGNENNSQSDSNLSDDLYQQIIEQNFKDIESNNS